MSTSRTLVTDKILTNLINFLVRLSRSLFACRCYAISLTGRRNMLTTSVVRLRLGLTEVLMTYGK